MHSTRFRHGFVYLLIFIAIVVIVATLIKPPTNTDWGISKVAEKVKAGEIKEIVVTDDNKLHITLMNGDKVESSKDPSSTATEQMASLGVTKEQLAKIEWSNATATNWQNIFTGLMYLLPLVIVVGVMYMMLRQAQGTNNQALSFGKSRARMFTGDHPTVTFEDVAGCETYRIPSG